MTAKGNAGLWLRTLLWTPLGPLLPRHSCVCICWLGLCTHHFTGIPTTAPQSKFVSRASGIDVAGVAAFAVFNKLSWGRLAPLDGLESPSHDVLVIWMAVELLLLLKHANLFLRSALRDGACLRCVERETLFCRPLQNLEQSQKYSLLGLLVAGFSEYFGSIIN